jgi:hypothetical protein
MIAWLNANSVAMSAIASGVSAFAAVVLMITTIVYARYTWQLTIENRLLRKAGTDPQVVAFALINQRVYGAIDFVIANIGKGAAQNVSFEIVSGATDFGIKNIRLPHTGASFTFLPQGEQISTLLGMGHELLSEPGLQPFEVEVAYEDLSGTKQKARFKVDVGPFEGLMRLGKPPEIEIAESVTKIADELRGWASRRLQVETMSVSERQREDEETRKLMEERRAKRSQQPKQDAAES